MENKNRSAFPLPSDVATDYSGSDIDGLSKREYFAGLVFQGLLANGWVGYAKDCAASAVMFADELLKALDNESKS